MDLQKQKKDGGKAAEQRRLAIKSMEHVLSIESGTPDRWRAAFNHFLRQRPEAEDEAKAVALSVLEKKLQMDKFASTKNGRMVSSTPSWLLKLLRQTDPEYFNSRTSKDFASAKHLRLMQKAFPEYFYPEVI